MSIKAKKHKVLEYNSVFQEEKDGGFSVWVPELPGCASQGETFEEAQRNIRKATRLYIQKDVISNEVRKLVQI